MSDLEMEQAKARLSVIGDTFLSVYSKASLMAAIGRVESEAELFDLLEANGVAVTEADE
jgi:hypothetical protein